MEQINHYEQIKELILSQYKDKPNFDSFIQTFANAFQELETAIFQVLNLSLNNATGKTLDKFGERVNMPRPLTGSASTDDEKYRALIYAKIGVNRSNGTWTDIINILKLLEASNLILKNLKSKAIQINYTGIDILNEDEVYNIIKSATNPISLNISSYHEITPFGFNGDSSAFGFGEGILGRLAHHVT